MKLRVHILTGMGLLAIWQMLSLVSPSFYYSLSSPIEAGARLISESRNLTLPRHLSVTAFETISGFLIGSTLGIFAGFGLWSSPRIAHLIRPYLFAMSVVPVIAFAPLIIIWFGIGIQMKIATAALAAFLVAAYSSFEGARLSTEPLESYFRRIGASRIQFFRFYVIPGSLHWLLSSLRPTMTAALLGAFMGELIAANTGLGYVMSRAGGLYDVPGVIAGGVYLILLGSLLQTGLTYLEARRQFVARSIGISRRLKRSVLGG